CLVEALVGAADREPDGAPAARHPHVVLQLSARALAVLGVVAAGRLLRGVRPRRGTDHVTLRTAVRRPEVGPRRGEAGAHHGRLVVGTGCVSWAPTTAAQSWASAFGTGGVPCSRKTRFFPETLPVSGRLYVVWLG